MKYNVCIITASRSEYGLLRWVIDEVNKSPKYNLQLVVTGSHLAEEQGYTYKNIEEDGYPIIEKVDMHLKSETQECIVQSMGFCLLAISNTFRKLSPDIVIVLGDRYELLPICSAALLMKIPIAHISGGDVTIGAIDNEIRNAVTMMSTLHFAGVKESADNIIRMRNSDSNVWTVGEPGLENFRRIALMSREELADDINIDSRNKWILVTLHPETQEALAYNLSMAENIFALMESMDNVSVVISKANADYGGHQINEYWEQISKQNPTKYHLYPSLGQRRYLSFMNECYLILGNSSSGIVEAPHIGIPVLNIGNRQKGRHICKNVMQVSNSLPEMQQACKRVESLKMRIKDDYFGDGYASEKIISHIDNYFYGNRASTNRGRI